MPSFKTVLEHSKCPVVYEQHPVDMKLLQIIYRSIDLRGRLKHKYQLLRRGAGEFYASLSRVQQGVAPVCNSVPILQVGKKSQHHSSLRNRWFSLSVRKNLLGGSQKNWSTVIPTDLVGMRDLNQVFVVFLERICFWKFTDKPFLIRRTWKTGLSNPRDLISRVPQCLRKTQSKNFR